ncbi:MAG: AAA family ATPase [Planctomycetaceae bacterium]
MINVETGDNVGSELDVFPGDARWERIYESCVGPALTKVHHPLKNTILKRLAAERDVGVEEGNDILGFRPNGGGLTNTIQQLINTEGLDRDLIEVELLKELNSILRPDVDYRRILVERKDKKNDWELQLEEPNKGRIRISQMGSGFKTVLLVLANLLLAPKIGSKGEEKPLSDYVFAFEELENNLHPSAQRRLFRYIRKFAEQNGCTFFITTHSNVVIDMFAGDDLAQILHVEHDGTSSTVTIVDDHISQGRVLDDLDVRASDLLQANSIVWVEGPSDRIYFNAWMKLIDADLIEGVHYQCLTYAGSLNKHFSFEPELVDELIGALKVNRNAILIADSDRRNPQDKLKVETARLVEEVNKTGLAWVTRGKEVENYIPLDVMKKICEQERLSGPNSEFSDAIAYLRGKLNRNTTKKVDLAEKVVPHLTLANVRSTLDLGERMDEVVAKIRKWNHMDRT